MAPAEILTEIRDGSAWAGRNLPKTAGRLVPSDTCLNEVIELSKFLDDNPLPTIYLDPDDFDLPACRGLMTQARAQLSDGLGFVIIDRLPLDRMTREASVGVYWLLMRMTGRPVAQSWDGKMTYDVADLTGKPPGNGIRPDVTNAEQNFHTDNSYNLRPPDHVALLCLHPAKSGGISRVVSLHSAHNRLRVRHGDLLPRLYRPFYYDRQREHTRGDVKFIESPAFRIEDGKLRARLSAQLIRQGYELADAVLDNEGASALAAVYDILDDDDLYTEFFFEPGQIQIVDNRFLAHKRTAFEDWTEPERRRHLVRIWLRDGGRPFYNG